jgi:hypothetical protein
VSVEGSHGDLRYRKDATSARRLRLDAPQLARCAMDGALDAQHLVGRVEIWPLEPEKLAAPKSYGKCDDEQGFEPVTAGGGERALCLGDVQSPALGCLQRRWLRGFGDIAGH